MRIFFKFDLWVYVILLVFCSVYHWHANALYNQNTIIQPNCLRASYTKTAYKIDSLVSTRRSLTTNNFIPRFASAQKRLNALQLTSAAASIAATTTWLPIILKAMYPADLFLFLFFQLSYKRILRFAHSAQILIWKAFSFGTPYEWQRSILGFAEERCGLFAKLIGLNYVIKLFCLILSRIGFRIRPDLPDLLSRISYTLYCAQFADLFKGQFLHTFIPSLAENRRQSYVVNRSSSVAIWFVSGLIACEMVSTFLKVPLSSTLAFGGVGGLAIGLSARDIAANFLGGMLLLFNEPFTPGDMVTFRTGSVEFIGRVERVGWGQTRIRGRDTRPTYIPNSHFVQTAVTNMERITHRKFETTVPLRFQDHAILPLIISRIKERLKTIPKLDTLSMPFRVSFIKIGPYFLEIEITCYFATKSIDEFLILQQTANMEVIKAIHESNAELALPTTVMQLYREGDSSNVILSSNNLDPPNFSDNLSNGNSGNEY